MKEEKPCIDVELLTTEEFCDLWISELDRRGLKYAIIVESNNGSADKQLHSFIYRGTTRSELMRLVKAAARIFYPEEIRDN